MGQLIFAERIRERYPEGLTGIFAIGGTRTTYVLMEKRHDSDPGRFLLEDYVNSVSGLYRDLFTAYFELGGQNLVVPLLSYQQIDGSDRGTDYARAATPLIRVPMEKDWVEFYHQWDVDPYFVGIDTLLALPEESFGYRFGVECAEFNKSWTYTEGRRKLIWEIAPIPLYSIWSAHQVMGEEARAHLETELAAITDLQAMHDILYRYYSHAVYGTDIPYPHFYLGSNRNGDLKLRSLLPIALLCGGSFRLYFTPYPSLFTTRKTLQEILEDLAFGKTITSSKFTNYSGQFTSKLAESEYQRILELAADPRSTLGLIRQVQPTQED